MAAVDGAGALADRYARSVDAMPTELREFAASVIEDGPQRQEGTTPPLEGDSPVEHEGRYYRFEYEIVATREETIFLVEIDYDAEEPIDRPTVAVEDLPPVDRAAVADHFPPPEEAPSRAGYDLGGGHRYGPADEAASVLVPDPEYGAIAYDGTAYPIRVERGRPIDVNTYEYGATQVAADAEELAASVRDRYRFALTGLTQAERGIVETAIEDGYYVEDDDEPPAAFESLLERFRAHAAIHSDEYGGDWLVSYDGTEYWASLGFPHEYRTTKAETPSVTPPPE
jgi:hypothetical protein